MLQLALFVSGRGSNLQAVLDAVDNGLQAAVKVIFTDKVGCKAVELAERYDIPVYYVGKQAENGFVIFDDVPGILEKYGVELVVLAGFLKLLPDFLIDKYPDKIINIHPALLPNFGGAGMYGMNVHRAVFNSSAKISGPTVHFVDKIYDHGKIIAQMPVDINDVSSAEEIAARVLEAEHKLLPMVIAKIAGGKVRIKDERVIVDK